MDLEHSAEALLARIKRLRDALENGQLTVRQVELYRCLGVKVAAITRRMDAAADTDAAEALWREGAALIRSYLDEHFPQPTWH